VQVLVTSHPDEVLAHHVPELAPNEANPVHIHISDFDESLQGELPQLGIISQLHFGAFAQCFNEVDNGVLVQILTVLHDLVDLLDRD